MTYEHSNYFAPLMEEVKTFEDITEIPEKPLKELETVWAKSSKKESKKESTDSTKKSKEEVDLDAEEDSAPKQKR